MDLEYDLFERMSDGSLSWKGFTKGLEDARLRLARLATETTNECFAVNVATGNVVDRANIPTGEKEISYDLRILRGMAVVLCTGVEAVLLITRKLMLEKAGYIVVVAVTKLAIIEACQQHAFHVAVVGQEDTPEKKNSVFSLIRRWLPLHPCVSCTLQVRSSSAAPRRDKAMSVWHVRDGGAEIRSTRNSV